MNYEGFRKKKTQKNTMKLYLNLYIMLSLNQPNQQ